MKRIQLFICLLFLPLTGIADVSFQDWLADISVQARAKGMKDSTLLVLKDLEQDPRVLKFDRHQPEFVQTFEEYLAARVTRYRIDTARELYQANATKLDEIADAYQVDARYLVAFWGLESGFGQYQGKYSIIRSLATLGYDARRSAFFTRELFNALQILDEGHIAAEDFVGGWAGFVSVLAASPSDLSTFAT